MKAPSIATGLVAAALVGTTGVGYVAVAAQPRDAEMAAAPRPGDPAPDADAAGSAPTSAGAGRDRLNPTGPTIRPGGTSARVLWAKLDAAAAIFRLAREAHAAARVQYVEVIAARGEVEALVAELNTRAEDLRDEVDLLRAQLEIRKADVRAAEVQLARAVDGSVSRCIFRA